MFNHGVKPDASAVQWIGEGVQWGRGHKLTVVVSDGTLYVLVDDNAYMTMPLSEVYAEWTATTTYKIGIGSFDIQPTGATVNNQPRWVGSTVSTDTTTAATHIAKFSA